jgi:hypothetical protein
MTPIVARILLTAVAAAMAPLASAVNVYGVVAGHLNTGSISNYGAGGPTPPVIILGGDNTYGQKGAIGANNTSLGAVTPSAFPRSMAFGLAHVIAALDDGGVVTWGDRGDWLGRSAAVDPDPVPAAADARYLRDARQVAAGVNTSYVLTAKGQVWSFGSNTAGALGNGTIGGTSAIPFLIPGLQSSMQISAQCSNAAIVDVNGNVWAWGDNTYGQLGQGAAGGASGAPVHVVIPVPVVSVAVGCYHMLAMTAGGQVYGWGRNLEGQIGLGNTLPQNSPVQNGALSNIAALAAGAFHSVALVGDGTIRTFGLNGDGQLGTGGIGGQQNSPQTPAGVTRVTSIAAGWSHTVLGVQTGSTSPPFTLGYPVIVAQTAGDNSAGQLVRGTLATDSGTFGAVPWLIAAPYTIRRNAFAVTDASNIQWRNTATGENVFWGSSDLLPATPSAYLDMAPVQWQVIGTADINFDKSSEIFWYNTASGEVAFWSQYPTVPAPTPTTAGTTVLVDYASIGVTPPASNWRPVAVGDIDGDGSADIIWRHLGTGEISVWYLSATGAILRGQSLGVPGAAWSVVNTGDFDGNGIYDIFFRNTSTGATAAWLMSAVPGQFRAVSYGPVDLAYSPQIITDLDGDGRSDIFWRNQATGDNYIWYINGTAVDGHPTVPAPPAWQAQQSFMIPATNVFTAVIWRNTSTGEVASWHYANRTPGLVSPSSTRLLGTVPLAWQLTAQ